MCPPAPDIVHFLQTSMVKNDQQLRSFMQQGLCNEKTASLLCKPEAYLEPPTCVTTSEEFSSCKQSSFFLSSLNTITFSSVFDSIGVFCLPITDFDVTLGKVQIHICGLRSANTAVSTFQQMLPSISTLHWRQQECVCVELVFWKKEIEPF